jgi:hypothetical protein
VMHEPFCQHLGDRRHARGLARVGRRGKAPVVT